MGRLDSRTSISERLASYIAIKSIRHCSKMTHINPENDCILVQTDTAFDVALMALSGLGAGDHLQVVTMQEVSIDNIESNHPHHRFLFGGKAAGSRERRVQAFAKTSSSVLRTSMLRSANTGYCPLIGARSHARNRDKMAIQTFGPKFVLTTNKMHAMEYYSFYDKMHPHFMFEYELTQRQTGEWWHMTTMMLIFRKGFSEVIEFTTNMRARDVSGMKCGPHRAESDVYPLGTFQSYVNVKCFVRIIKRPNHDSLRLFKALHGGTDGAKEILRNYQKGLIMVSLDDIPFPAQPSDSGVGSDDYEESEDEEDREFLSHGKPTPITPTKGRYDYYGNPAYEALLTQMAAIGLNN